MKHKRELGLLFLFVAVVLASFFFPLERLLVQTRNWSDNNPALAAWLLSGAFFLSVLLLLPVSPWVMLAGFLFGLVKGLLVVWTVGLVSSSIAFLLSRTLARPWVERRLLARPTFKAIDRAIGRSGLRVALLTRLAMMLPYGPVNYSLGVSSLKFRDYLVGTNLGALPAFFIFVYLGTTVHDFAALMAGEIEVGNGELLWGLAGLLVIAIIVVLIVRSSLRILREELS